MLRAVFREGYTLSAGFDRSIAKNRLKRFSIRPRCRIHWLSVVVRIKDHRAFRFWCAQLAENYRSAPADGEQMRFDSPRLQHLHHMRRVLLDVRCVARNVRDGKEFAQFADDAV